MRIWILLRWSAIFFIFKLVGNNHLYSVDAQEFDTELNSETLRPYGNQLDKKSEFRHWGGKRMTASEFQQNYRGPHSEKLRRLRNSELLEPFLTGDVARYLNQPSYGNIFWSRFNDPESLRKLVMGKLKTSTQQGSKRQGFNAWAGKRSFNSWAGKRSVSGSEKPILDTKVAEGYHVVRKRSTDPLNVFTKKARNSEEAYESAAFNPWAGKKRSISDWDKLELYGNLLNSDQATLTDSLENQFIPIHMQSDKRDNFNAWAGKRNSPVTLQQESLANKRSGFNAWAGKRNNFNAWAGKRNNFNAWAGKRDDHYSKLNNKWDSSRWTGEPSADEYKRNFNAWAGKRSIYPDISNDISVISSESNKDMMTR